MRATKNRPEIEPSVIVFRPRGAQVRRRVAAGLLAAAVFALTAVVVWEASRSAVVPRPKPPQGVTVTIPAGWENCTNTPRGYSIAYPGDWHTTDVFDGIAGPGERVPMVLSGSVRSTGQRRDRRLGISARGGDQRTVRRRAGAGHGPRGRRRPRRGAGSGPRPPRRAARVRNPQRCVGGERAALRVRDRARRRNDADRAHDADSGRGGRVRGQQGRGGSRGGHAAVPGGLLAGASATRQLREGISSRA